MSNETVRGHGLSSQSLISDRGVELESRKAVSYVCDQCDDTTTVVFAFDAEDPLEWTCSSCGATAFLAGTNKSPSVSESRPVGKSPFEMLLERRTRDELETILSERLAYLRARRGLDVETT